MQRGQHLARAGVGTGDLAVLVQAQQARAGGVAADLPAGGPRQVQAQGVRAGQHQGVFDAVGGLGDQVLQLGIFARLHAGHIEHAQAGAVGAEQGRAGAAVDGGVVEEVLAAVQPHGCALGQGRADGAGPDARLRQVYPHARDGVGGAVAVVDGARGVDDAAVRVGQQDEVADRGDGGSQAPQFGSGGGQQGGVGVLRVGAGAGGHGVELHARARLLTLGQAAAPALHDPGAVQPGAGQGLGQLGAFGQHALPCQGDLAQARVAVGCGQGGHRGSPCLNLRIFKPVAANQGFLLGRLGSVVRRMTVFT